MQDLDPVETQEWLDALESVLDREGEDRAHYLMTRMGELASRSGTQLPYAITTPYRNTIPVTHEARMPGDLFMERRIRSLVRWNALAMVMKANKHDPDLGGHISSFASSATLYDIGFNYFFQAPTEEHGGDLVFFQGHASPGVYARAFLEGRISEDQLNNFRQEVDGHGLSSYPHPWLMPDFWQFPTVSMGLGPIQAIYQARFMKYLESRGFIPAGKQKVWCFMGDGECDEPESLGAISLAGREKLDNLIFVINCNLQRLDGPVRGNGKIIQELESFFRGAGWNVIKVIWGREWDDLLARDTDGALLNLMNITPDGDYQTYKAENGAYVREHFFGRDERAAALVKDYTDEQIWNLKRGGHDYRKVYAAFKAAVEHKGQPTVILAKTIKGYGLGPHFEGRNATHQMKKMTLDDLKHFRDAMHIPITDAQLEENPYQPPYYNPGEKDETIQYMRERRRQLGGFLPERRTHHVGLSLPGDEAYTQPRKGSGTQEVATTMAFVRLLKDLLRTKDFGHRIVPIIPDEARTFGIDAFFPTAKIYNPHGQHYTSVDRELLLAYKESPQGQIVHVGINEAGALAAFTATGTSYATHGEPLIPVYVFYSMFGFQRTGDAQWAAGDQMARGFVIGATAGRTTLTGEGLQHADGHSQLLASTNPATVSYDPAYGYEIAHIVRSGLDRMYGGSHPDPDVMYYLTVYNEPLVQPAEPEGVDVDGIVRGIHRIATAEGDGPRAQLFASGVAVPWALEAQQLLRQDWGVQADVWSVTSWSELRRDGLAADEHNFLHPDEEPRTAYITDKLRGAEGPVVAVSDFMNAVQDQIRPWVPNRYATLGADGFGFSDTRAAARRFFKIDGPSIVVRTLQSLAEEGKVDRALAAQAIEKYRLHDVNAGTTGNAGGES